MVTPIPPVWTGLQASGTERPASLFRVLEKGSDMLSKSFTPGLPKLGHQESIPSSTNIH